MGEPFSIGSVKFGQNQSNVVSGCDPIVIASHDVITMDKSKAPKGTVQVQRQGIIAAFRQSHHYSYYADYVKFLLGAGCRPVEACALRWKHITDDCAVCG